MVSVRGSWLEEPLCNQPGVAYRLNLADNQYLIKVLSSKFYRQLLPIPITDTSKSADILVNRYAIPGRTQWKALTHPIMSPCLDGRCDLRRRRLDVAWIKNMVFIFIGYIFWLQTSGMKFLNTLMDMSCIKVLDTTWCMHVLVVEVGKQSLHGKPIFFWIHFM